MVIIKVAGIESIFAIGALIGAAATIDGLVAGMSLGDAFLTGIISGVSAGALAKIGNVLLHKYGGSFAAGLNEVGFKIKVLAHGAIGGMTSVLQGGKFGHGFASSVVSTAASGVNNYQYIGGRKISFTRIVIAAGVGGTASKISGGKFANGAMSAAFSEAASSAASKSKKINYESPMKEGQSFEDYFQENHGVDLNDAIDDINSRLGRGVTAEWMENMMTDPEFGYEQYALDKAFVTNVGEVLNEYGPQTFGDLPTDGLGAFKKLGALLNLLHGPLKNTKYIGPGGHLERIYNRGSLDLIPRGSENAGSCNFMNPLTNPGGHMLVDMRQGG